MSATYDHQCTGCEHFWNDRSKYTACPWCGEPCTNTLVEEEAIEWNVRIAAKSLSSN